MNIRLGASDWSKSWAFSAMLTVLAGECNIFETRLLSSPLSSSHGQKQHFHNSRELTRKSSSQSRGISYLQHQIGKLEIGR